MVVAFETLFLGLVFGAVPVRVAVGPEVATVELRLDGAPVATLRGAPWVHGVQLGPAPHPHELEAVARSAAGKELARARQRLNLPRAEAEVHLVIERGPDGGRTAARLTWDETAAREPTHIEVTLDGAPVLVEDRHRVVLPPVAPAVPHVITVELTFPGGTRAHTEAVFGGDVSEEVRSDLTAVPLVFAEQRDLPTPAVMARWLSDGVEPLRVVGIERGPAEVVFVVDQSSAGRLSARWDVYRPRPAFGTRFAPGSHDDRFYVLLPSPRGRAGRATELRNLYPFLGPVVLELDTLCEVAVDLRFSSADPLAQSLGNAVALAGLHAAGSNRRRAVVLVLASNGEATGTVRVAAARAFLADLSVPLVLWSIEDTPERRRTAWGEAEDVSSLPRLRQALGGLTKRLEDQSIVWVEGSPLPQRIALDESLTGVRIAR